MTTAIPPRLQVAHAITLKNPWAHLIAHCGKDVENRSWMPHDAVNTLLIHAGKGWADRDEWIWMPHTLPTVDDVSTSAIVAVVDLAFACNTSRYSDTVRCRCGEWAMPGQCHWKLTNVVALPEPVPATGRQGLWRPTPDQRAAVARSLDARTA
ncbi:hypothetical protein ACWD69_09465 [Micromonospora chokoriensis]